VRAGDAYTISGIPSGSYPMYITGGRDWDAKRRTFTRSCEFKKLGNKANLTSDGFRYTIATLTLGSRDPRLARSGTATGTVDRRSARGLPRRTALAHPLPPRR